MAIVGQSLAQIEKALAAVGQLNVSTGDMAEIRRRWRATMAGAFKREAIPAMKRVTPMRTGKAARSLRVKTVARPYGLEVGPGKAGFYLQFHPDVATLQQQYRNIIQDVWDRHSQKALNDAIGEVLNL